MKLSYITTLGIILMLSGTGCKRFLEQEPTRQTSIKNVDQLQALVDNSPALCDEPNNTAVFSTDDTEIPADFYKNNVNRAHALASIFYYVFDVDMIVGEPADNFWSREYRNIFTANTVLDNVEMAAGSATDKAMVKADAHFLRAYSYWMLANYYCLPYSSANLATPGLPLKKTSNVEESLKRSSLGEVYQFILDDLNEAMKVNREDVDASKRWRVTRKTVEAMLSRYYLFTEDYPKSLEYANRALSSTSVVLKDYKTIIASPPIVYNNPTASLEIPEMYNWSNLQTLQWPELYYPRYTNTPGQWFQPSESLLQMYEGQNDLRYKWFVIENGGRRFSVISPIAFRYSQFSDGRQIISGPSRAEMLLNKAEALARTGKPGEAMNAVNELRAARFTTPTNLSAADTNQAIKNVLAERRREFPFAMRWMDIRRFSINNYPGDDVTVTRNFFKVNAGGVDVNTPQTYTLPVGSKRYMVPINGVDINASNGQIEQNKY
ncbi:hypothetical protein ABIE26_001324 [Pedobacter africanus]|uniref:Uncharacterized protein n=1 Tax=Pedobacter africanus TaxID=151894 RepID=A0ACC6KSK3_9SPHI|nr:RagB/SusD family nutrient uptake outer membrane protein [Pedobacter africanus]MDR6782187.1 hypothetical protein [Pedobacter africanus]